MKLNVVFLSPVFLAIGLFSCGGPQNCDDNSAVTYDGHSYDVVAIGDQCWFAENLRTNHYANGDSIPGDLTASLWNLCSDFDGIDAGARAKNTVVTDWKNYAARGNGTKFNFEKYGYLYNWYAVIDDRGLCPAGWHVPSDEDFKTLELELGMDPSDFDVQGYGAQFRALGVGEKLKASNGWDDAITEESGGYFSGNGSNESGFSALPGGYRSDEGRCDKDGITAIFWTSSTSDDDERNSNGGAAWYRGIGASSSTVSRKTADRRFGMSVRCVRDAE